MSLGTIADYADLVAALGVMISLVFVGVELRRATNETRRSNWREILDTLVRFKGLANDPALADLIIRGNADYEALSAAERLSYAMYLEQGIHVIGNFPKHSAHLPQDLAHLNDAVDNLMRDLLDNPGARAWWQQARQRHRFMAATARGIDTLLCFQASP